MTKKDRKWTIVSYKMCVVQDIRMKIRTPIYPFVVRQTTIFRIFVLLSIWLPLIRLFIVCSVPFAWFHGCRRRRSRLVSVSFPQPHPLPHSHPVSRSNSCCVCYCGCVVTLCARTQTRIQSTIKHWCHCIVFIQYLASVSHSQLFSIIVAISAKQLICHHLNPHSI